MSNDLEKAWKLIKIFAKPYLNITDYRNYLIKKIPKKYTIDEFYSCEKIIDKLFWDLRDKLEITIGDHVECNYISYDNASDLELKLHKVSEEIGTYYRSFINKLIIVDKNNKKIYYKKMDGSSNIFDSNNFNLLTLTILFDRKLYQEIMDNPINSKRLRKIPLPKYYYQLDYCFPNVNCCKYNIGSENDRIDRIRKMYYMSSSEYWYKLIL